MRLPRTAVHIQPAGQRAVGTGKYCRLAPLAFNASFTGLVCDQTASYMGAKLVYSGTGLKLTNGSYIQPEGPDCTMVGWTDGLLYGTACSAF
jgi:hypothetical protein